MPWRSCKPYGDRVGKLEQERTAVAQRLSTVESEIGSYQDTELRRSEIQAALQAIPDPGDRVLTKVFLRKLIETIVIGDGEIKEIRLR
jgi:hypothetical protein